MATTRQLRQAARRAGFRGPALLIAVAIALAESGGNEGARNVNTNGSVDTGAWQINSIHSDILAGHNPYDLQQNADMAFTVYKNAGKKFTPWVTYKTGAYKSHLTTAQNNGPTTDPSLGGLVDPNHTTPTGTGVYPSADQGNILAGIGELAGNAASAVPNPIGSVESLITAISQPALWKRVGLGFLAFILLLVGLVIMLESNQTVRDATKSAAKVAAVA